MSNEINQSELWPVEGSCFFQVVIETEHIDVDDNGKEKTKKTKETVLFKVNTIKEVEPAVAEYMRGSMDPWKILKIEVSKINCIVY